MLSIQKTQVQLEKERMENPPEKMEVLQEELELEKEKKEIISSLYNDWIYEYNVQERKLTTISGSGAHYSSLKGDESEQKYLMLDDLHPEDRAAFVECCKGKYNGSEPSYMEARIMVDDEYRWISLTTRVLKNRAGDVVSVIGKISDIKYVLNIHLLPCLAGNAFSILSNYLVYTGAYNSKANHADFHHWFIPFFCHNRQKSSVH